MQTYRITYTTADSATTDHASEEVHADHLYIGEWCACFNDAQGSPLKVVHANAIYSIDLKHQTH